MSLDLHADLPPREIVQELDKYIIGQKEAKRAVAIALRNRHRRKQVPPELKDEISPKNIILMGPTGVGKTEIARRLARLDKAPFIKVEATKFTEVGYVGRDVESIIRDLLHVAVNQQKKAMQEKIQPDIQRSVEETILDILLPPTVGNSPSQADLDADHVPTSPSESSQKKETSYHRTRQKLLKRLREGDLDEKLIEVTLSPQSPFNNEFVDLPGDMNMEQMDSMIQHIFRQFKGVMKKKKTVKVKEARKILTQEKLEDIIDSEDIIAQAIARTENNGIVFLDEIDKIVSSSNTHHADVSRQGVQRDLLPLIEGSAVNTRYGVIRTDHILFVAAGAFHMSSPSEMIPELQGRFPIRVELESLSSLDMKRILMEPKNALIKQYQALLATEGVSLSFDKKALESIASFADQVNRTSVNIGARRLITMMEKLLEDILYDAPDIPNKKMRITESYVTERLQTLAANVDVTKYIL